MAIVLPVSLILAMLQNELLAAYPEDRQNDTVLYQLARAHELAGRVKVQGQIVRLTEEGHMILRDETGQVEVETAQRLGQMIGQTVAAVGVAEVSVDLVQEVVESRPEVLDERHGASRLGGGLNRPDSALDLA